MTPPPLLTKSRGAAEPEHLTPGLGLGGGLGRQLEEVALEAGEGEREGEGAQGVQRVRGRGPGPGGGQRRGAVGVEPPELGCNFVEGEVAGARGQGGGRGGGGGGQRGEGGVGGPAGVVPRPRPQQHRARHRGHRLGEGVLLKAACSNLCQYFV